MKRRNPYVGPRAFEEGDRHDFFGREREIRHLESLVVARRGVLLYAASGAGKTSLLKAGLIPCLRARDQVAVMPTARVIGEMPLAAAGADDGNLYVFNTLCDLLSAEVEREELWGLSLSAGLGRYLDTRPRERRARPHLLILDQFEELFTSHPDRYPERADFFGQLRECLFDYPRVTLLLSMREEYIGELYPFEAQLPDRLRCRFRIELLGEEAAQAAAVEPARRADVTFRDAAARRLVDDLRTIRVRAADGSPRERHGPYVEPVELQVVCRRLWERLPAGSTIIDTVHLETAGSVERALADYYAEQVTRVADATGVPPRTIRDWCEHQLITEQGIRAPVLRQADESEGLATTAVEALVDAHLVRAVERRGATWFELAHDRLIGPVQTDNAAWCDANLNTLQRQAALWERAGRPGGLILRGEALDAAERWVIADAPQLTPAERDFLSACRRARAAAQQRHRQASRLRRYAAVATVVGIVAGVASLVALFFFSQARIERDQALARGLAAHAMASFDDRLDLALLLGVELLRRGDGVAGRQILLAGLDSSPRLARFLHGHRGTVWSVAWSPDGRLLASGSADGTLRLWDPENGRPVGEPLAGHRDWVWSVAWSPDGRLLASGGRDRAVLVWDLAASPPRARRFADPAGGAHQGDVYSVAWSPDGHTLASAGWDGTAILWDVASGMPAGPPLRGHDSWVTSIAFSPDGQTLATGSFDRSVILWHPGTRSRRGPALGHESWVTTVAWSPEGQILAAGGMTAAVVLWDPVTGRRLGSALDGLVGMLADVAFRPDGRILAAGSAGGRVMLWDLVAERPLALPFTGGGGALRTVAFHPDGRTLASGNGPAVILWDVASEPSPLPWPESRLALGHTRIAAAPGPTAALRRDGATLATGGGDTGRRAPVIRLWDTVRGELRDEKPLRDPGDRVSILAWSPDGRILAAGSGERAAVSFWDLATGEPRGELLFESSVPLSSLAFHPDGAMLAAGREDGTVVVRAAAGGAPPAAPLECHRDRVSSLAFSPGGDLLATGGWDQTIRLWDVAAGSARGGGRSGHLGPILSLAFAPDGRTLASGGWTGAVLLWDPATGNCLGRLAGHAERVVSLAFSADGRTLISADAGGEVIRWDVDPDSWHQRACRIANRNLTVAEWNRCFGSGVAYRPTCPSPPAATGQKRP